MLALTIAPRVYVNCILKKERFVDLGSTVNKMSVFHLFFSTKTSASVWLFSMKVTVAFAILEFSVGIVNI